MTPERILELAAKCDLIDSDEPVIDFAQAILKERDEERDSLIQQQDMRIEALERMVEVMRSRILQVLEHRVGELPTLGYLRDNDKSRATLDELQKCADITQQSALSYERRVRNETLDQAAAVIERQDVDPAFKLRMASSIRSLREELPNPQKL